MHFKLQFFFHIIFIWLSKSVIQTLRVFHQFCKFWDVSSTRALRNYQDLCIKSLISQLKYCILHKMKLLFGSLLYFESQFNSWMPYIYSFTKFSAMAEKPTIQESSQFHLFWLNNLRFKKYTCGILTVYLSIL